MDDVGEAWRQCDHSAGVRGHKFNGLSVALDGSEDHLLAREAAAIWKELDMAGARLRAIEEVDALVDSGEVALFADWQKVIRHPSDPGVVGFEGGELEDGFEPCEAKWVLPDDIADMQQEEIDIMAEDVAGEVKEAPVEALVPLLDEAVVTANRVSALKRLRAEAVSLSIPAAVFNVDRQIRIEEKTIASGQNASSLVVSKVLKNTWSERKQLRVRRLQRIRRGRAKSARRRAPSESDNARRRPPKRKLRRPRLNTQKSLMLFRRLFPLRIVVGRMAKGFVPEFVAWSA